ncbi:MAG TPA: (2Fe-2S)-binding protein [Burkholderiaceae bacterium]|jgi:bacterioferritin-associated ferredoxin|nr:(2Fe-2S)-binding protein [Burkholderiaceae bacterium]
MVVCLCHRVTDRDIARAARSGCTDYEALQDDLRVGTSCGTCDDCAREVFAECSCAGGAFSAAPTARELAFA